MTLRWFATALLFISFAEVHARRHGGAPPPAPVVVAQEIKATEVFDTLIYPAKLVSRVNATLLSESDGIVQSLAKPLGAPVQTGETIFTLINPDPVYTYAPLRVLAPVTGVISGIEVTVGSRVSKGQKLGSVTDPSQVRAVIEVTVADLPELKMGQKGFLELSHTGEPVEVSIAGISPLVDPATGTASAELRFVDNKRRPPPGLVGRVRFRARLHKGLQLPESAIFYRGEQALVRVMDGEKAVFRPVKLGPSRQGHYEIVSGIQPGETVVLRTNTFIADGEKVTRQKSAEEG